MKKHQFVNPEDVISIAEIDKIAIKHKTFTVKEFMQSFLQYIGNSEPGKKWCFDGVDCELLAPGQPWRKGKIKITLEFIPEEPESPLDEIRREIQDKY
ncbi:KGK domain-containing protein [Synechocystis sp. LKSZ1]|uniref:KGK domain-containing protein n=1 Tax=Synechocystis sp. LKSZ1 TaxID=3144951 RepID=UPI00336BCF84